MNFKIFLIIYLQLIYTSLANLKLTPENIVLPTMYEVKGKNSAPYSKLIVNASAPLVLTFKFEAKYNELEKSPLYFFNGVLFEPKKNGIVEDEKIEKGQKLFYLIFKKYNEKIAGNYTMKITTTNGNEVSATSNIFSPPFLHEFLESKRTAEGGRENATCKYTVYPEELNDLYWEAVNKNEPPVFRSVKSNGSLFKDTILWDLISKNEAGFYRCFARNEYGNDTVILRLRVKDKLAPLWPFIGIVIEIIILFAVIIFYERQKSSKKSAEMDANPTRQSLLADTKNSEINEGVRHRNSVE